MSLEKVTQYFQQFNLQDRITKFDDSTATVDQAAAVLHVKARQIAKTMAFKLKERAVVVVTAGNARVSNPKFKALFGEKPHMVKRDVLEETIGHPAGGVCPFALREGVDVYLDESLKEDAVVYPAAGTANTAIRLNFNELEQYAHPKQWVDVAKDPEGAQ